MRLPLAERANVGNGLTEGPVSFDVQHASLKGILVRPERGVAETGLVFVHGWSGNRCGPHGILTTMARAAGAAGYPSLRFDFRGRGESGGDGLGSSLVTMADDLVAASRVLVEECGVLRIVYFGICSGGNVTVGTLNRLPLAGGLVLLSVYPFSDGDAFGRDVHRTWHYARVYWKKAMQKETWTRLFRGDVHVLQVFNVLFGHFLGKNDAKAKEGEETVPSKAVGRTAAPTAKESRKDGGEAPKKHLANLRPNLPALMIYGTSDPDAPAARRYFGDYAHEHNLPIRFVAIDGANHNFSSAAWKRLIADMTVDFCKGLAPVEA